MRAVVVALATALVVAGTAAVLAIRRRAMAWREWDEEPSIVGMPTWPYRGEVN